MEKKKRLGSSVGSREVLRPKRRYSISLNRMVLIMCYIPVGIIIISRVQSHKRVLSTFNKLQASLKKN